MDGNNQHLIYEDLLKNSKRFFRDNKGAKARTSANLIENLSSYSETIETFANKAYPVIHESMIALIETFLNYKLQNGSSIEKDLYKDISVTQFIDRLISKRPLAFLTTADSWLTREGEYGAGGWGEIGTEMEGETYKVLKMFQDTGVCKDLNEKFKQHLTNTGETQDIDFSMQVLSSGSWPFQTTSTFSLPTELERCITR